VYEDSKKCKKGPKLKPDLNQSAESDEETLCMGKILINKIKHYYDIIKSLRSYILYNVRACPGCGH
jgi:hypothetical protein